MPNLIEFKHLNLLCFWLAWTIAASGAQSEPEWRACTPSAEMPTHISAEKPLNQRQRFELRECGDGRIFINAYRQDESSPSLTFDTGDPYPIFLVHVFNVLVLQSPGGSSDHIYVFSFNKGHPVIALRRATKALMQVRQSEHQLVLSVPPTTYPDSNGRFPKQPAPNRFTFRIDR